MMSRVFGVSLTFALASSLAVAQSTAPAVFVTNNVGDSVTSFTVNPDGTLNRVDVFPSGDGPQTTSLTPDGRFLAVANGTASVTTEELRIFRVNADATLTHQLTTLVPNSPLDVQWLNNAVLAVTDTTFGSANAVDTYQYDDVGNVLTPVDSGFTGSFSTRLATARAGSLLYANNSAGANSIYAFDVDPSGTLSLIENQLTGSRFGISISTTHDGNFLYGAGGISGTGQDILGFSIDPAGALDPLPPVTYSSPGDSPKVLALTEDDEVMIVGHGGDATFWSFLRNPLTGDLAATANMFDVGLQGTLGDLQIMDDLLFVTDSSTAIDGITGIYSFRVHPDGSFTQLGPILETLGARPEYIATWRGAAPDCDFDSNTLCDIDDLNALLLEGPLADGILVVPGVNDHVDINGDGVLDLNDLSTWLASAADVNGLASPYKPADANLDGFVDAEDFIAWNQARFTTTFRWDEGNFNGDRFNDAEDFIVWNSNKFTSSDNAPAVPEPGGMLLMCGWLLLAERSRRGSGVHGSAIKSTGREATGL